MANEALQRALQAVLAELQKADGAALTGAGKNVVEVKAEVEPAETHLQEGPEGSDGPEMQECQDCAAGTCANPDHMDDDSLNAMAEGYG